LKFEFLFAFLVVGHGRRQLLGIAVTRHPTAEWLPQQIEPLGASPNNRERIATPLNAWAGMWFR